MTWLQRAIATASKAAASADESGSQADRSPGRQQKLEHKKRALESRRTRGGHAISAAAAAAAVAAAGESGMGAGSPDILKPVDNDEREHLDPYIAKLQKRQRQQQRSDQFIDRQYMFSPVLLCFVPH